LQRLKQSNHITVNEADLASSERAKSIRVLHVDDDPSNLEISKQIMKDMDTNLEFDCVCCVDEAFKKLSTGQYDVVISDFEMPQKDGIQFLSELRKQNNEIPFILFTWKGREDVAVKALNLGDDSYINKNDSSETVYCELVDAINKTLERKKSRKLLAKSESKYHAPVENKLFYENDDVSVPETNKQKLFDQGFTTGRGIGLGLHLIKKMIEVYGRTIEENGEPSKGAKFTIRVSEIDRNSKMKTD
jgi:DNA-binding NarL/FixJ family response regulator